MTRITLSRGAALAGAVLLPGCLLLTACSGGPSASSSAPAGGAMLAPEHVPGTGANGAANGPAGAPLGAYRQSAAGAVRAIQAAKIVPISQSIIYTASLTLRSPSAMTTAQQAIGIVTAAGGYTAAEQAVGGSPGHSGGTVTLTLKVPVPVYQAILAKLSAPGLGKLLGQTQQATDVTQEVANVNSLVTSQQAAITALQGLLRHAATVPDLLQVQQQISADESSLESLQAQQRALDHETSYATVNMTLLSTQHAVVHKRTPAKHGFLAGMLAGWRALRHATGWLLTALGTALPFLIVLAILAAAGYAGRRRVLRGRAGPTAAG